MRCDLETSMLINAAKQGTQTWLISHAGEIFLEALGGSFFAFLN